MKNVAPVLIILFPILLFSCKKTYVVQPTFSGITETDINGQPNGTIDNTDWTLNASWQNFENNLFPNTTNINSICAIASSQERPIAYPNPCNNLGTILFKIPVNSTISIRVLDTQLNQLVSQNNLAPDSLGKVEVTIDYAGLNISSQMTRAYYVISNSAQNCVFRGQGDIEVL